MIKVAKFFYDSLHKHELLEEIVLEKTRKLYEVHEKLIKTENKLKETTQMLEGIFESHNRHAFWSIDIQNAKVVYMSPGMEKIYGYKLEDFSKNRTLWKDIVYPEDRYIVEESEKQINNGKQTTYEVRIINKEGSLRWVERQIVPIFSPEGKLIYMNGITFDITEQKQTETRIREQAALLDKAQDAIIVRDLDYNIIYWNKSAERLYGWTESEVKNCVNSDKSLYIEKTSELVEAQTAILEKGEWIGELKQSSKFGNEIIVQSRWNLIYDKLGQPKSILTVNTDITEKKRIEEQFFRTQRLESIGNLASGIAHDFNNILAPIMISVELLRMNLSESKRNEILETLDKTAKRGANIVKQLLFFGRGIKSNKSNINIYELIFDFKKTFMDVFPKSITFENEIQKSLWNVLGDKTQLEQIILNLFVNARDAMPEGGILKISGENIYIDKNFIRLNPGAKPGPFVCIEITDTGTGISPEIMDKIFDPFFTTKEIGKGTGLGLSTLIGIVKSHGGFVNAFSEPGKGSQFKVYLPALKTVDIKVQCTNEVKCSKGNGEMIMLVEDEAAIRKVTQTTLENYGYKVLTAKNGLEGLEVYKAMKDKIKIVITDINMPKMDGITMVKSISNFNPQAKFIINSGLMSSFNKSDLEPVNSKSFLQKPYSTENLLKEIMQLL